MNVKKNQKKSKKNLVNKITFVYLHRNNALSYCNVFFS